MRRRRAGKVRRRSWLRDLVLTFLIVGALAAACHHTNRTPAPEEPSSTDASNAVSEGQTASPVGTGRPATKSSASKSSTAMEPSPSSKPTSTEPSPASNFVELPACLKGCPSSSRGGRLLEREGWVLFNNPETKFADWAAYRVSPSTIGRSKPREWKADPDLPPEETLEPEDFRGAHDALRLDRGHQVPLASFSGVRNYQPLNYMSNVTPQRSVLNQKLWNLLEQAERKFVLHHQAPLFVVTGPLYEEEMGLLPGADEPHRIPSGYFKVIAFVRGGRIETAAFIAEQSVGASESYCDHAVTIDEVERRARLDVFPLLPEQEARALESEKGGLFQELGCL